MQFKRFFLTAFALLLCSLAKAVPACPGTSVCHQPDGSIVKLRLHGDEYRHFTTTADGYTVVKNAAGFYVYAELSDSRLVATQMVAHDVPQRTDAEQRYLNTVAKYQAPAMTAEAMQEQQAELRRQAQARSLRRAPQYDYSKFRGLVILIEYNDQPFSRSDYKDVVTEMITQDDYTGYYNTNGSWQPCTGSVRDYFRDNSMGLFVPDFDIYGPYQVNYSQYDGSSKTRAILNAAVRAADADINFADYDGDDDGVVDMVFFVLSGMGAQYSGNDDRLWWPHRSVLTSNTDNYLRKDGVTLWDYASGVELQGFSGQPSSIGIDGIGTFCHEFSHVLGLPDFYDSDGEGSGGESAHPGEWSLMDGGCYLNSSRTPVGYSLFERYAVGFATPEVIDQEGRFELETLAESNTGYRLNTVVNKEFFIIENRQKTSKWERYLPGHGMLVFRVDSTNVNKWEYNQVNANPKHTYYTLLRAGGGNGTFATTNDPFPGNRRVTTLNNSTSPANLLTWSGQPSLLGFENIRESGGVISFDIVDVNVLRSIELQETITLGQGLSIQLEPVRTPEYAPYTLEWFTDNPAVATVDARGVVSARQVGQAVISVVANGDENLSARCVVTVEEPQLVPDITSLREQADSVESVLSLNDALVVFASGSKTFVRDASSALCIDIEGLEVEAGDVLNGIIFGKKATVNNIPMLVAAGAASNGSSFTVSKGHEVTPRRISIDELTDADRCDLVTLTAVTLERSSGVWAVGEDKRLRLYNVFQVPGLTGAPKSVAGKYFDVTGIYYTNTSGTSLIDEIEMTASVVEVEAPSAISSISLDGLDAATPAVVYTTDGRLVARATIGRLDSLPLRHGLYIVKTAVKPSEAKSVKYFR